MKSFESLEDIRNATEDELQAVQGFNRQAAKSVYDFFRK
jgi:excinuclease ABC subunit C